MWPNRFETISIKEVLNSELAVLHSDGIKVFEAIEQAYKKDDRLKNVLFTISFDGIERVGYAFLNACIGKAHLIYCIKCVSCEKFDDKINEVIANATKHLFKPIETLEGKIQRFDWDESGMIEREGGNWCLYDDVKPLDQLESMLCGKGEEKRNSPINKCVEKILIDYPEKDKIHADLVEFADQQASSLRKELEEKDKALNHCHKRMAGAYDEINRLNKLLNPTP